MRPQNPDGTITLGPLPATSLHMEDVMATITTLRQVLKVDKFDRFSFSARHALYSESEFE